MSDRTCGQDGCERGGRIVRGMCMTCYKRLWKRGEIGNHSTCSVGECPGLVVNHGYCNMHYQRWRKTGDPGAAASKVIRGDDAARFESWVDRSGGPDACHLWLGNTKRGYGNLNVSGKFRMAHHAAYEYGKEPIPAGHEIDHECHNVAKRAGLCPGGVCEHRRCCNPRHLIARTRSEHTAGINNGNSRLTEDQVREIRSLLRAGIAQTKIGKQFGISQNGVSDIKLGRTYSTVPDIPAGAVLLDQKATAA